MGQKYHCAMTNVVLTENRIPRYGEPHVSERTWIQESPVAESKHYKGVEVVAELAHATGASERGCGRDVRKAVSLQNLLIMVQVTKKTNTLSHNFRTCYRGRGDGRRPGKRDRPGFFCTSLRVRSRNE